MSVRRPIPKVRVALMHWRSFPTEIASDLSTFHRRHIREWHQGSMTSRELVDDILPFLPDRSAYKTAMRRGDWTDDQYRQARIGQEIAYSRADNSDYMPDTDIFLSPLQLHMKHAVDRYQLQAHQRNLDQLKRKRKGGG